MKRLPLLLACVAVVVGGFLAGTILHGARQDGASGGVLVPPSSFKDPEPQYKKTPPVDPAPVEASPELNPRKVPQGGVVLVTWSSAAALDRSPEIACMERVFPMVSRGEGRWAGIVGVDLEIPPGRQDCQLRADGRRYSLDLEVYGGGFPEERLTLPADMVSPPPSVLDRIQKEARRLAGLWPETTPAMWDGPFSLPLASSVITPFGVRRVLNGVPKSPHKGIDMKGTEGTPVGSVNRGRVVLSAELYYGGRTVVVDHGAGIFSYYMHLAESSVSVGQEIARGQVIGTVGKSGRATGPHLHFGVKIAGANVDPRALVHLPVGDGA